MRMCYCTSNMCCIFDIDVSVYVMNAQKQPFEIDVCHPTDIARIVNYHRKYAEEKKDKREQSKRQN